MKPILRLFVFFAGLFIAGQATALGQVTPPAYPNVTISYCSLPSSEIAFPNLVIAENAPDDFSIGSGVQFTLSVPASFTLSGTVSVVTSGTDITSASATFSDTQTLLVTYTTTATATTDQISINGLTVLATAGGVTGTLAYNAIDAVINGLSNGHGFLSVASDASAISVNGGTLTASQKVCLNQPLNAFSVSSSTASATYQWEQSVNDITYTAISGQTGVAYTPTSTATGTLYYRRQTIVTKNGIACSAPSNAVSVTIIDLDAGTISDDQAICYGETPVPFTSVLDASAQGEDISYSWEKSTDGQSSWQAIANNSATYASGALTQTTSFRRIANSTTCTATKTSNVVTVSVGPQINGGTAEGTQNLCLNDTPVALSVVNATLSGGDISYQWESSTTNNAATFTAVSGTGSQTATFSPPTDTAGTFYYRRITTVTANSKACSEASTVATVVVTDVNGGVVSGNQTICFGAPVSPITISGDTSVGNITYQWLTSTDNNTFTLLEGSTGPSLTPSYTQTGTLYFYRLTYYEGASSCFDASDVSTLNVITVSPGVIAAGSTELCYGSDGGTIGSTTDASAMGETVTYSWEKSIDGGTNWTSIPTNSATLATGTLTQTTSYRRLAQSASCGTDVYSNEITKYVAPEVLGGTISSNQALCVGAAATPLTISGDSSSGNLSYKWYTSTDQSTWNEISTETGVSYTPPTSSAGTRYYYRATTVTYEGYSCVASSTIASVAVSDLDPGSIAGTQTICLGDVPATLTSSSDATASGTTVSYQWQQSIDDGVTWTNLSGSGSATNAFTPSATITQTTLFRRNATSTSCSTSEASNVVYVYVNRFPTATIAITFNDGNTGSVDICPGANPFPLEDNSSLAGDGDVSYLWQQSTNNGISWSTASGVNNGNTYDPPSVTADIWYRKQTISTLNGETCTDFSNVLKFIAGNNADPGAIKTSNTATGDDQLEVVCVGDTPSLIITKTAASVTNGTLSYQWYTSTSNSPYAWSAVSGAISETFSPTAITQTTFYMRAVTNTYASGDCTIYNPDTIVEVRVPTPGTFDANQAVCYNTAPSSFTESVPSIAETYLTFQWQRSTDNSTWSDISGATNKTYASGTLTQTTYFRRLSSTVVAGVSCATDVIGNTTTVTVLNPSAGSISGGESICVGDDPAPILSGSFATSGSTYEWYSTVNASTPNWVQIPGETGTTYDPPTGLTQTTYYKRVAVSQQLGVRCTASTNSVTIQVSAAVDGGTLLEDQILCPGEDPATLTVTDGSSLSGITYSWYSSTDITANETLISTATATTYTPARPSVTTWYKRVTTRVDNGQSCEGASNWVKITINDISPGSAGVDQTICAGETPSPLIETAVMNNPAGATITYQWQSSADNTNWTNIPGATSRDYSPGALTATTYYRRNVLGQVNATQCVVSSEVVTISVTALPVINNALIAANDLTMVSCFGGSDGAINIDPSRISGGNSAQQQIVTLTVSGTLATGDVITLQLNGTSYAHTVTSGQTNAQVATALANLVNTDGAAVVTATPSSNEIVLRADTPGTAFSYIASAGDSAQGRVLTVLTQANALPNTYAWTKEGSSSFNETTLSIAGLSAGVYTLAVTNGSCVVSSQGFTITEPDALTLSLDTACTTSLTATPVGGTPPYTYTFTDASNNSTQQSSSAAVVYPNLIQGASYTVSVKDAGCSAPVATTITIPTAMSLVASELTAEAPSCSSSPDGSISLSTDFIVGGNAPYSYAWTSNAFTGTKTTANLTNLAAGIYTLVVTDNLGCSATTSTTLTALTPISITSFAPSDNQRLACNGDSDGSFNIDIAHDASITPIIRWYKDNVLDTAAGTSSLSYTNLGPGNYRVEVSNGLAGACMVSQNFTISAPDPMVVALEETIDPLCFSTTGGQATFSVTGGTGPYYYTIDGGSSISFGTASATAITYTIQNIAAGAHNIVITDSNSCAVSSQNVTISVPTLLEVTHDENTQVTPIGCTTPGSLSVSATGGTGAYFYEWTGPNGYSVASTSATANDIFTPGNYTVKVTDKNQCSQTLNVNMPNTATTFTVSGVVSSEQCVTDDSTSSSILLTLSPNIVSPYTIRWEKYGPSTQTTTSTTGSTTVSNTTTVFGWNEVPGSAGKLNLTGLGFGEYRATVQDANTSGCNTVVEAFTIAKSSLSISENVLTPPSCDNPEATYSFKLNATNPLKYYLNGTEISPSSSASSTFSLSNSTGKYTLSKLVEGSYTLRIVEQVSSGTATTEGCELFTNFTVANYQPITYGGETNVTLNLCDNEATFPNTELVSGGVPFEDENGDPFYIYQWNGPNNLVTQGSEPIAVNAGTYELRIIDAENCITDPITFNFSNNVAPVTVTETITPLGCGVGNTNGAINISISGGKAPYQIVWEREIPGTEENPTPSYELIGTNLLAVNNLASGRYRLRITSSFVSCDNTDAITFTKFYELAAVETLQLLEGPFLSKSLCVGEPGTLQVKVFDRDSDTFSFYYDGTLVSNTPVGNDTYELTIDNPVDEAILNILNESGCGISVPIITGVGEPDFSYTSRSLEQTELISANEDVTFTNTSIEPYTKMRWDFGDGSDLLEITAENEATTDIIHRYKTPGTFTVALRFYNALGCYKETTQEIRVGKGYLVIFPSAFTPNEDGVNDLFQAKYTGITAFTLEIFDMWGNLLYTSTVDSLPTETLWGWNGEYPSGKPYTFKTFRYSFTAMTHDEQEIKTAGEATLLR